jgi:hypothetical protein
MIRYKALVIVSFLAIKIAGHTSLSCHESKKIHHVTPLLDIQVNYPYFADLPASANKALKNFIGKHMDNYTQEMELFCEGKENEMLHRFKKELGELLPADVSPSQKEAQLRKITSMGTHTMTYQIIQANNTYISIIFDCYNNVLGCAHPSENWHCFNYDVKRKKIMKLADLFDSQSKYLEKFSALCAQDLQMQFAGKNYDDLIKQGTVAHPDNFAFFTFTQDQITLYFAQYQVAPYSLRPQVTLKHNEIVHYKINTKSAAIINA